MPMFLWMFNVSFMRQSFATTNMTDDFLSLFLRRLRNAMTMEHSIQFTEPVLAETLAKDTIMCMMELARTEGAAMVICAT